MWFWYTMGRLNEGHSTCFIWNPNQKIYEIYFRLGLDYRAQHSEPTI
jgi:hypothetical protein